MVAMGIPAPPGLDCLVRHYSGKSQEPVRFRLPTWQRTLSSVGTDLTVLLADDRYTRPCSTERFRRMGDRTATRHSVQAACAAMNLDDREQVLRCFVMVMAWGSGTTGTRALRHTAQALADLGAAHQVLADSAQALRQVDLPADGALQQVHADFALSAVGQAFFTKWFSFAGYVPCRAWQPLILDSRVIDTLNKTLEKTTKMMAGDRRRAARYASYVEHLHRWPTELAQVGCATDAERLEWVMFEHRGKPLPEIK
jgi:hypothetical protein